MSEQQAPRPSRTSFPMQAELVLHEPQRLEHWDEMGLYTKLSEKNAGAVPRACKGSPLPAHGQLDYTDVLNAIFRDILARAHGMTGTPTPLPIWSTHHLSIERRSEQRLSQESKESTPLSLRKECRKVATELAEQKRTFYQRMGLLGHQEPLQTTMSPAYEAKVLQTLAELVRLGALTQRHRPIHWCGVCAKSLAESELLYEEQKVPSLFVGFPLISDPVNIDQALRGRDVELLIWTTEPWTLPATKAIAIAPDTTLAAVRHDRKVYLLAESRVKALAEACKWGKSHYEILLTFPAQELLETTCRHPFIHQKAPLLLSPWVDENNGTGITHVTPAHSFRDYAIGRDAGLDLTSPINLSSRSRLKTTTWGSNEAVESNAKIIHRLKKLGAILNPPTQTIQHQTPHCWLCQNPLIMRSASQWFLSLEHDNLRKNTQATLRLLHWTPPQSQHHIRHLLLRRPEWCLTRQRRWGIPLPVFYCTRCRKPLLDHNYIRQLADEQIAVHGSDLWFERSLEELLPKTEGELTCQQCGHHQFRKGDDLLDPSFVAAISALQTPPKSPETLPLHSTTEEQTSSVKTYCVEKIQQHRNWLQSTLLLSNQLEQTPPFQSIITHDTVYPTFVPLGDSKHPAPEQAVEQFGADILRWWATSVSLHKEHRLSTPPFSQAQSEYKKIRNTCRFMLSSLEEFQPEHHTIPEADLASFDRLALARLRALVETCNDDYRELRIQHVAHELLTYCRSDLSSFYFESVKSRLTPQADEGLRQAIQTTLYHILNALTRLLAPLLCFTADECWAQLPDSSDKAASVHLASLPAETTQPEDEARLAHWSQLKQLRQNVHKCLVRAQHTSRAQRAKVQMEYVSKGEQLDQQWLALIVQMTGVSALKEVSSPSSQDDDSQGHLSLTIVKQEEETP